MREGAAPRPLPERPRDRLTAPLRRRPDGTFEEIDWDTAIARGRRPPRRGPRHPRRRVDLLLRRRRAGEPPRRRLLRRRRCAALGARFRSNALAQEKTGEFWVNGQHARHRRARRLRALRGRAVRRQEPVAVSHGIPHARTTLKEIANDPAALDDRDRPAAHRDGRARRHPPPGPARAPTPGCSAAMVAVLVEEDLRRPAVAGRPRRRARRGDGRARATSPIADFAARSAASTRSWCARPRAGSRGADSVAVFEDLGVQMNRHSTLVSYLEKLRLAAHRQPRQAGRAVRADGARVASSRSRNGARRRRGAVSPVVGARIIGGLCRAT